LKNFGQGTAYDIVLTDTLPRLITVSNFSQEPDSTQENVLFWNFDSLTARQEVNITFWAIVNELNTDSSYSLVNVAAIYSPDDSTTNSKRADRKIIVIDEDGGSPSHYDLGFTKTADRDTVFAGEEFLYTLSVINYGPAIAYDVVVTDTMPDLITPYGFNPEPDSISGNIYYWKFDSIPVGQEISILFTASLGLSLPKPLSSIKNVAGVYAPGDTNKTDDEVEVVATEFVGENCETGYYFDENLFVPDEGRPLNIYFYLSSSQIISLDLYDITGYHIATINETEYDKGLNKFQWQGRGEHAQHIGSGVYIIALRAKNITCWKKVILVR
jgi:uncharacterized repeat protein (TIGR01451 family)